MIRECFLLLAAFGGAFSGVKLVQSIDGSFGEDLGATFIEARGEVLAIPDSAAALTSAFRPMPTPAGRFASPAVTPSPK